MDIVGVSRARTSGSYVTKSGKKAYRGQRRHWYVYYYDDDGKFRKREISAIEVPYYGSLIRRTKTFRCKKCGTKFRSMKGTCPKCGNKSSRVERSTKRTRVPKSRESAGAEPGSSSWSYKGSFTVDAKYDDAPLGQR